MAQVLVPGVAQLTFSGTIGTQPWVVVHHWRLGTSTADWTQGNMTALVNAASTAYNSRLNPHAPNTCILTGVSGIDIGAVSPILASNTTQHPGTGTGAATGSTATAVLVSNNINYRFRGGHPRSYWPHGLSTDTAGGNGWSTTFMGIYATAMASMVSDIVSALPGSGNTAGNHCVPLYTYEYVDDPLHHKYRKVRSGLKAVVTVSSYSVNQVFGTQRRRLHA